jgi:molecular chaperone GrpE
VSVEPDETQVEEEAVVETASAEPAPEPEAETPELDPIAAAEARAQEYLELAQRKQAEFENFRKRASAQAAMAEDRGVTKLAKELLPALDHLELALKAAEQHAESADWVKGIRSVQEEFKTALGRAGIEAFAPLGEAFDPTVHEAMAQAPIEGHASGTIAEVYQAGYRLSSGAVIRPARVVVAQ